MSTMNEQLKYIETELLNEIIMKNFNNRKLIKFNIEHCKNLDGFMSALYEIVIKVADPTGKVDSHHLIAKFMKGDKAFREATRSYIQFVNEIFIYSKVLPYYQEIVEKEKSSIKVSSWTPHAYITKHGNFTGLGNNPNENERHTNDIDSSETILVLENLKPKGFRGGPQLYLDRQHLVLMTKPLAEYHSFTYALRIRKDPKLQEFIDEIIPLPFSSTSDRDSTNFYQVLYSVALERFFDYFDRTIDKYEDDYEFISNVNELKRKYYDKPTELMERFRETDDVFSVILHGDYNRNNVLFRYGSKDGFDDPKESKMIDFQELRYGTPAIDLSFSMYMNMEPSIRNEFWMELVKFYHSTILNSLADILKINVEHESLEPYSFNKFYQHFSKFAFYGVMICMHFLPWIASSEDECSQLSRLFETDVHGDDFKKLSIKAGGDKVNERIMEVARHASRMGYMSYILK